MEPEGIDNEPLDTFEGEVTLRKGTRSRATKSSINHVDERTSATLQTSSSSPVLLNALQGDDSVTKKRNRSKKREAKTSSFDLTTGEIGDTETSEERQARRRRRKEQKRALRALQERNDMEGEKTLTPDSVPPTAMTIGDETSTSSSGQSAERVLAAADENGLSQAVAIPISMAVADDALPDLETPPDSINFSREASNLSSDIVSPSDSSKSFALGNSWSSRSEQYEADSLVLSAVSASGKKKGKKKSSWYTAFYPTYKSRSDDFKKLFSTLPREERLIVEYSCALQRDILVHGRMYATLNYLCFYANIFGWETSVSIPWPEVISITKEKTALVIPNAIQVNLDKERNFFTSFAARDKAYTMLVKLWKLSTAQRILSRGEMWGLIHDAYGNDLGLNSDDEPDYVSPTNVLGEPGKDSENSSSGQGQSGFRDSRFASDIGTTAVASVAQTSADIYGDNNGAGVQTTSAEKDATKSGRKKDKQKKKKKSKSGDASMAPLNMEDLPMANNSASDDIDDEEEDEVTDENEAVEERQRRRRRQSKGYTSSVPSPNGAPRPVSERARGMFGKWSNDQQGREMISEVFDIDADDLFTLLFTKSKFYIDFHSARKTFDIVQSPWQTKPGSQDKSREVSLTLTLSHPMGPKHSQVTETQTLSNDFTMPGELYVVNVDTINSGIPYADSFYVQLSFGIFRCSADQAQLTVYAAIKYRKYVWGLVKNFIEKNSWSGLEDFYQTLSQALKAECIARASQGGQATINGEVGGLATHQAPMGSRDQTKAQKRDLRPDSAAAAQHNPLGTRQPLGTDRMAGAQPSIWSGLNSFGNSDNVFKIIVVFLIALLLANSLLFYQMWFLESKLNLEAGASRYSLYEQQLRLLDPELVLPDSEGHDSSTKRTTEQWLMLLQKQEMIHQMELEKWHEMLSVATDLLRKTEQSLSNLQRSIHPLTMQKLRAILYLQQQQEVPTEKAPVPQESVPVQGDVDRQDL